MQSSFRHTAARAALRTLERLAWFAFFAFAATFLALRFWLLPQIERYEGRVRFSRPGSEPEEPSREPAPPPVENRRPAVPAPK